MSENGASESGSSEAKPHSEEQEPSAADDLNIEELADVSVDETAAQQKKDEALASLANKEEGQIDARLEERFIWIIVTMILLNIIWFSDSENPSLPFVVLVLELVILFAIARKLRIDAIVVLINNVFLKAAERGRE